MKNLYGLLGCPVEHSMSPEMHNDLFAYYGIDGYYHAFHVEAENLGDAVIGLKALNIKGFNVTIPHKVSMMGYLDEIDEIALNIGAVNTVINNNGKLVGYNTDGDGFIKSLEAVITKSLSDAKILIIGSGGAARGILISLAAKGASNIDVSNRTLISASQLRSECKFKLKGSALSLKEAEESLQQYDVIINTTSVGMHPNIDNIPLSLNKLLPHTVVSDIIYNPLQTSFLIEATRRGAVTLNGVGMFVNQGALAFHKWTGRFPDVNRMEQLVINKLGGHAEC